MRRLLPLFLLGILWTLGLSAASAQPGRNPFLPASAASAPAAEKQLVAAPALAALPKLPSTVPGPYRAPQSLIPPPPPGLALPPLQLPSLEPNSNPVPTADSLASPDIRSKGEKKLGVFLSREQLAAERAKCIVALKSPTTLTFTEAGGRQTLKLSVVGGRQCVKGVAASEDWVEVSSMSASGELVLIVHENDLAEARSAEVNIANTGTSLTVKVFQSASKDEYRQLTP